MMTTLTNLAAWQALTIHQQQTAPFHMRDLFAMEPERAELFCLSAAGLTLDYSKNRIIHQTIPLFTELAQQVNLAEKIQQLLLGDLINFTEQRAALHTALRHPQYHPLQDTDSIIAVTEKMAQLTEAVHTGHWRGYSGQPIRDIVNIGIGGSDLGPALLADALLPFATTSIRCHFISNIDPYASQLILSQLDPATTLFIISSKSFTTLETITNATMVRDWFTQQVAEPAAWHHHFFAVTADIPRALEFGITKQHIFPVWDWVGGRYSIWSAIGLPIMLLLGVDQFKALLAGAYAMDQHFSQAPFRENMPVLLALLGIWYHNFFHANTHAIIPYVAQLRYLPAYLQQADMESNGKHITRDAQPVTYNTGPILWGSVGCNSQHSFHQLLHQGTHLVPVDFIVAVNSPATTKQGQQQMLVAQALSQSQALMRGKDLEEVRQELTDTGYSEMHIAKLAKHLVCPGNQPSNTIIFPQLNPHSLGALLALYEHKIFVQGVIWGINSFDQFGVELGKKISAQVLAEFEPEAIQQKSDSSTLNLIHYYHLHKTS